VIAGFVLWGLASACSAVSDRPTPGGARWGGDIDAGDGPALRGFPLALEWDEARRTESLYRLDPRRLDLMGGLPLHTRTTYQWDLSPDGRSLLLASGRGQVRVVDALRMRGRLRTSLGIEGVVEAAWVADDVALLAKIGRGETEIVRLDPTTGTVLDLDSVPATAFATADATTGIAMLAYAEPSSQELPESPPPVVLAVMDASGALAVERIEEVGAGHFHDPDADSPSRALPALAVRGSRATIVGTDGRVVTVDLTDMEVTVEGEDESVLDVLAAWFTPPAQAKVLDATELHAEWASDDALLVSGYRTTSTRLRRNDVSFETEPAGAVMIDADDWSTTVIDEDATSAQVAGDVVLASNGFLPGYERRDGIGLRGYAPGGGLAWQVLDPQFVRVMAVHRDVAFVDHGWHRVLLSSVDLETGEVLKTREMTPSVLDL
jgi:hypothetical protein